MVNNYLRRAYSSFAAHIFDIPPRFMVFLLCLTLLLLPLTGLGTYYLSILAYANVIAIFAASWDLLVGRTGQISLGHALFFGVGGYTTGFLSTNFGLPIWMTIPLAVLIGCLTALLIGFPCLRVKGPYLALITMAFPLIISRLIKWVPLYPIFGGEGGIKNIPSFFPFLRGSVAAMQKLAQAEYYLTLFALFVCAVIIYKVANSKTGIVFMSILDDELASKACGINITKYKLMSLIISGLFATLAGCLLAHISARTATPWMFDLTLSFAPVIVTFLGGIGTIYGPIVGAYVYAILDKYFLTVLVPQLVDVPSWFQHAKLLIFTSVVVILIIKWPRGVARFTTDRLEDLEEARDLDERGPRIWKRYKTKKKK